ncbi:MAG: NAD-dependent succinate-semialdehyde dehydrogenase [Cyanobacteria bacterium REEB459]|nr:NAD-dependent succinate-semialdehyde dehydrogenase [Cyanobacteria bacterium REEB459]
MAIASINPATGITLQVFDELSDAALEDCLAQAAARFDQYRHTSFEQRAHWLTLTAEVLEGNKQHYGQLITAEMGKPLAAAISEVEKSAWVCRFYADHGAEFLAHRAVLTDASHSFVCYQPLGPILAVMPWNFPFWQVFRFAAPALMAGNVGLLKHASNVPQCALAIEAIFANAGFPPGVFQTLLIGAARVANVVADDRIKAATLTGSEAAGASLAAACGHQIKKTVLELGGTDPFIVMPSADLEAAVSSAATARMLNNGQSCIAAKRFLIHEAIVEAFLQGLKHQLMALQVGDPMVETTTLGPLATPRIVRDLVDQVQACLHLGAIALLGGDVLSFKAQLPPALQGGNWFPPTILTQIPAGTPADHEEFFGPVALVFAVKDLDQAIQIANSTPLGLGASGWSQDPDEQQRLTQELDAGAVFINSLVKSDPRLPFGGIKRSGYGRELGQEGIHEFVNIKTVWIK